MPTFNLKTISSFMAKATLFTLALTLLSYSSATAVFAGQTFKITVDQARIMRLSTPARTIIVGNPVIADVSIQDEQLLVVMGKSSGSTNMIALDEDGREILNIELVVNFGNSNAVTLFKGSARASMNCSPTCERTLHVGDSIPEFKRIEEQITKKLGAVRTAADFTK